MSGEHGHLVPVSGGLLDIEVGDARDSDRIRSRICEVSRRLDEDRLELGALFFRARTDALFLRWTSSLTGEKYKTWDEYVATETHFSVRSIHYMVAMWWWFSALKVFPQAREMIREVGWSKACLLIGLAGEKNYEQWFEIARANNRKRLKVIAKASLSRAGLSKRPAIGGDFVTFPNRNDRQRPGIAPEVPALSGGSGLPEAKETDCVEPVDVVDCECEVVTSEVADVEASESNLVSEGVEVRTGFAPVSQEELVEYETEEKVRWYYMMDHGQREHVDRAVEAVYDVLTEAKAVVQRPASEEMARGLAVELMATHFLAYYTGANAPNAEMRTGIYFNDMLRAVERGHGVDVVAVHKKDRSLLYGLSGNVLEAVERLLGVDVIAYQKGTKMCVHGYDAIDRILSLPDDEDGLQ